MTFTDTNGTRQWTCDHCLQPIGNSDSSVLFYEGKHFHLNCYEKGVEHKKLHDRIFKSNSAVDFRSVLLGL
jgi:hypothetical protein